MAKANIMPDSITADRWIEGWTDRYPERNETYSKQNDR
jgi:hypothetical protein